jgi:hypothetical protein
MKGAAIRRDPIFHETPHQSPRDNLLHVRKAIPYAQEFRLKLT